VTQLPSTSATFDTVQRKVRDAIDHAAAVVAESGARSAPIPVERIARRLGVQVRYAPFDGDISGMASIQAGVKIIAVNSLHHPNRQRFTLGHELCHILRHEEVLLDKVHLDKGSLYRNSLSAEGTDAREREANAFASELLMPETLLKASIDDRTDIEDDETVERLAKKFRVSIAAMHYRLMRL
jgi:Zn-dependent peptidase ImmA (M78 family)